MDQDEQVHLFDLPEEIIETIVSFLDLLDLKILSQSCRYLSGICGKRIGKSCKITFSDMNLSAFADIFTFKKSMRKYENLEMDFFKRVTNDDFVLDFGRTEKILKQVKSLPSMNIKCIIMRLPDTFEEETLNQIAEMFESYLPNLQELHIIIYVELKKPIPKLIHTCFQRYKLTFKLNLNDPDVSIFQPIEFRGNIRVRFDQTIESIKNIDLDGFNLCDLKKFLEVENLDTIACIGEALQFFQPEILKNKETLRSLTWDKVPLSIEGNLSELPCQLRSFSCSGESDLPITLLNNQRNLRDLRLSRVKLSEHIFTILSNQHFLSKIAFYNCTLENSFDSRKFEPIKNLFEIELHGFDMNVLEATLANADKVIWLKVFDSPSERLAIDGNISTKVLTHLRVVYIFDHNISEYILSRIEAPNLEECYVSSIPAHFRNESLKKLTIVNPLTSNEVENILGNLPYLEVVHLKFSTKDDIVKSVTHMLNNLKNIVDFVLHCLCVIEVPEISEIQSFVETTLNTLGISFSFKRAYDYSDGCDSLFSYQTDNFSFEIRLYSN